MGRRAAGSRNAAVVSLGGDHTVHSCELLHKFERGHLLLWDDEKRFDKNPLSCEENTQIPRNLSVE